MTYGLRKKDIKVHKTQNTLILQVGVIQDQFDYKFYFQKKHLECYFHYIFLYLYSRFKDYVHV